MDLLNKLNLALITVLSVAAAVPKLMRMPAELSFFASLGMGGVVVLVFGLVQLIGGLLMLRSATRAWGGRLAATAFLASAIMLLATGQLGFGLVSLVPVAMAVLVASPARAMGTQS